MKTFPQNPKECFVLDFASQKQCEILVGKHKTAFQWVVEISWRRWLPSKCDESPSRPPRAKSRQQIAARVDFRQSRLQDYINICFSSPSVYRRHCEACSNTSHSHSLLRGRRLPPLSHQLENEKVVLRQRYFISIQFGGNKHQIEILPDKSM